MDANSPTRGTKRRRASKGMQPGVQPGLAGARAMLQDFLRYMTVVSEGALTVTTFHLPDRKALWRAGERLPKYAETLFRMAEESSTSKRGQETALRVLQSALQCAFVIGACGTASENAKAFLSNRQIKSMHEAKKTRRQENPANQIIGEAVERNRAGGKKHLYKAIVSDAQPKLKARGCEPLTDKAVRERAARVLNKTRS